MENWENLVLFSSFLSPFGFFFVCFLGLFGFLVAVGFANMQIGTHLSKKISSCI